MVSDGCNLFFCKEGASDRSNLRNGADENMVCSFFLRVSAGWVCRDRQETDGGDGGDGGRMVEAGM